MAPKKPKPKPTNKPMKSPVPPKYDIPKGIPAWQKKILEDEYEYKFGKYMEKVKAWEKSQKGK